MTLLEKAQQRSINVLFVCVGNACRSQMAEAFAQAYGSDVIDASSAGLVPAARLSQTMQRVMAEKQIRFADKQPRRINAVDLIGFDLIVNLSEYALPKTTAQVIRMVVPDPAGKDERFYREIRDCIEKHVESLISVLRKARGIESQQGHRLAA